MNDHVDMSRFIAAKSDQLNADDLMDNPRTITIAKVTAQPDAAEQPVSIHYEGGEGRPWKPCKTMRRILVGVWGKDASKYVGRSLTIYRDPAVAFGGLQVGGIRVSHMSHITEDKTVALMVTRGRKAPFKIKPLKQAQQQQASAPAHDPETGEVFEVPPAKTEDKAAVWADWYLGELKLCETTDALIALQADAAKTLAKLEKDRPELFEAATNAGSKRATELQSEGVEA